MEKEEIKELISDQLRQWEHCDNSDVAHWMEKAATLQCPMLHIYNLWTLLFHHHYRPKFATEKHGTSMWDISKFFPTGIDILIGVRFTQKGYFDSVFCFLPDGTRFHHYHGGSGDSGDCIGSVKVNDIPQFTMADVELLKNALDVVVVNSVTDGSPSNRSIGEPFHNLPSVGRFVEIRDDGGDPPRTISAWEVAS